MAYITILTKHPEYAPILAFWAYKEWYQTRSITFDLVIKAYEERTKNAKIPVTWIVIEDEIPVGMVSLKENDLWSRKDLNPWLASLFVLPEYRNRGLGYLLIRQVIEKAKSLKYNRLHLFTESDKYNLENYYIKSGWSFLEKEKGNDKNIIKIFYYNLD
ncbi:MAG: GNAT family N-acetyltransferase [Spirochaetes bacterium]|nr:GNAT family N-acetyltransferase [Spirochaetota bacterium]